MLKLNEKGEVNSFMKRKLTTYFREDELEDLKLIQLKHKFKSRSQTIEYLVAKYRDEEKNKADIYKDIINENNFILNNMVYSLDKIKEVLMLMNSDDEEF